MKNLTTLSLITATIIGLTGCGGDSATTTTPQSEASSLIQANSSVELENKVALEAAVEIALEKNTNLLKANGLKEDIAKLESKKFTSERLGKLNLDELEAAVLSECNEDEKCKEEAYASFTGALTDDKEEAYSIFNESDKEEAYSINLILDKEEAYAIVVNIRANDKEEAYAINDGLVKEFSCEVGEIKTVQHYGLEDNFSTANGDEVAYPSSQVINNPGVVSYNNSIGLSNYDTSLVNRQFAEEIKNLPSGITKGMFYMGLENHGSNDRLTIGNMDTNPNTLDVFGEDVLELNTTFNWNKNGHVYSQSFENIDLRDNTSLKDYVQSNNNFDVYVQDDTYVDFITVATCSVPDPIKEVTSIVNKFECSEKETLVKILAGEIDNFTATVDPTTPRANLITQRDANTVYPGVDVPYDYTSYDHHFIDTLNLGLTAGQSISTAHFSIGYKIIGSPLASNDAMYVGDFGTNHAGGHLYDAISPIIPQGWNVNNISGYGHVANVDLFALQNNSVNASGSVAATMESNNYLDVYVQDDTAVDFTQLNLCVKNN